MNKATVISAILVIFAAFPAVFGAGYRSGAELGSRFDRAEPIHSETVSGKTDKGRRSMCLAIDLRTAIIETYLMTSEGGSREYFLKAISNLEGHLKGTSEGDIIEDVLRKKDLTYYDLIRVFEKVERILAAKLKGEEGWAFRTGLKVRDILLAAEFGLKTELAAHLADLESLIDEGKAYASEEELGMLTALTEDDVAGKGQAEMENIAIQSVAFTELYLGIA